MVRPLESALSSLLDTAARDAPEPSLDLYESVHAVVRRRRWRRVAGAGVAATVTVLVVAAVALLRPSAAEPDQNNSVAAPITVVPHSCTFANLPLPSSLRGLWGIARATDIDPSGRYIVGTVDTEQGTVAVLWVDGEPRILDVPSDVNRGVRAIGVNSAGVVVGETPGTIGPWVYRDGRYQPLPPLPGATAGDTSPSAINSRGDIVGRSGGSGVIWPGDRPGEVHRVGDGNLSIDSISDTGLMVTSSRRVLNRDGTARTQPRGFEAQFGAGSWVYGQNSDPPRPVMWNVDTDTTVQLAADSTAAVFFLLVYGLGESGAVIIELQDGRPAVIDDSKLVILPLPEGQELEPVDVSGISGDGRTILGKNEHGAMVWRC